MIKIFLAATGGFLALIPLILFILACLLFLIAAANWIPTQYQGQPNPAAGPVPGSGWGFRIVCLAFFFWLLGLIIQMAGGM